jgi:hypothetical protein
MLAEATTPRGGVHCQLQEPSIEDSAVTRKSGSVLIESRGAWLPDPPKTLSETLIEHSASEAF